MTISLEVEVDATGQLHPVEEGKALPQGRALLIWSDEPDTSSWQLSEAALATDWLRPEEDEAWAHLQPAK